MVPKICRLDRNGLAGYLRNHPHPGGVIVNPAKKIIYMKPAKTAGTSILRHTLEPLWNDDLVFHKKDSAKYFAWLESVDDEALSDYTIFTVVRDPWDRMVSNATYFRIPVESLIKDFENSTKTNDVMIHTLPQYIYAFNGDRCFVDMICRFETLQADLNIVFDSIGVQRIVLPHKNASAHRGFRQYYNEETVEIVRNLYANDIRYFGYEFGKADLEFNRRDNSLIYQWLSRAIRSFTKRKTGE